MVVAGNEKPGKVPKFGKNGGFSAIRIWPQKNRSPLASVGQRGSMLSSVSLP